MGEADGWEDVKSGELHFLGHRGLTQPLPSFPSFSDTVEGGGPLLGLGLDCGST